jgi:hypothetical protein
VGDRADAASPLYLMLKLLTLLARALPGELD